MTPEDLQLVEAWAKGIAGPVTLGLVEGAGDRGLTLEAFGRQLAAIDKRIVFKKVDRPRAPAPALAIGERIFYQALPQGPELAPFLEALAHTTASGAGRPDENLLAGLALPATMTLYIAPRCPFCPQAAREALALALASDKVQLTLIDAVLFAERAAADNVLSTPTLILDAQARWVGQVPRAEVVDQLLHPDPFKLSASSLERLLADGQAGQVATMMAQGGRLFAALVELLADARWSVRLGAMVAVETLAEMDRPLAARLQAPIWQVLDRADPTVQGDLIYVIGVIGGPEALAGLNAVMTGRYDPAVKEAAAEAIDRIAGPAILS